MTQISPQGTPRAQVRVAVLEGFGRRDATADLEPVRGFSSFLKKNGPAVAPSTTTEPINGHKLQRLYKYARPRCSRVASCERIAAFRIRYPVPLS